MVFALIYDILIGFIYCFAHAYIIAKNYIYFNNIICPPSIACANSVDVPYIPMSKDRGFTAHSVKKATRCVNIHYLSYCHPCKNKKSLACVWFILFLIDCRYIICSIIPNKKATCPF